MGRGDVFEILEHANLQGISVGISTNATMATRAVAQRLGELGVESFKVSMEAGSEKSYDYIRNDRAYRKAIRGIRNLKEFCPKAELYFHAVLQRDNLTEIPALIKQAEKMEVGRIVKPSAMFVESSRGMSIVFCIDIRQSWPIRYQPTLCSKAIRYIKLIKF